MRKQSGWLAVGILMMAAMSAWSATWYVAPGGSDLNLGKGWGSPFATLQKGVDSATRGDTVLVSNGTYSISASIRLTNGVIVQSLSGPSSTTIRASSAGIRIVCISVSTSNVLDGFAITGGNLNGNGAGIYVDGTNGPLGETEATIRYCIITNNTAQGSSGGGIACGNGAVTYIRNCLVAANYGGHVSGISGRGGSARTTIESCTITRNDAPGSQPAVYSEHSATTYGTNCISYDNFSPSGGANILNGNWVFTLSSPVMTGVGNTNVNPLFVSTGTGYGLSHHGGNFRLQLASPCLNTGTNMPWMGSAVDLDGTSRILDGLVDRGAYETVSRGPLSVLFSGSPNNDLAPLTNVFTAIAGGNTNGIVYRWDFDGDGEYDTAWLMSPVATNVYTGFGAFSVVLMATNTASEVVCLTNASYVHVSPPLMYVALGGGNASPFTNLSMAATTITNALNLAAAGATIFVNNGTYLVTAELTINKGVTVRSLNGPNYTAVRATGAGCRVVRLTGAQNIVFDGFTVAGGNYNGWGAGICVDGQDLSLGSTEATIRNCIVTNNTAQGGGGALGCGHAAVTHIQNCLVAGNYGAWVSGLTGNGTGRTTVENCTVTRNESTGTQPAVYSEHTTLPYFTCGTNVISYDNIPAGGDSILLGNWVYTLSRPVMPGTGNINTNPLFVSTGTGYGLSAVGGNFRLQVASPCVNTGTNATWMSSAVDLDGKSRILDGLVDKGAYETRTTEPLSITFVGAPNAGLAPLTNVFTATPGGNTTGIVYRWDFDADGSYDTTWLTSPVATNVYTGCGTFSVVLAATNTAGEVQVVTNAALVRSSPLVIYVSLAGGNTSPFTDWGMAATTITNALDLSAAGATIVVSNGAYSIGSQIAIDKGVTVRSLNGPTFTTVRAAFAGIRIFYIAGAQNVGTDGFTVTGGNLNDFGAGIYVDGTNGPLGQTEATIRYCIVTNNTAQSSSGGGIACGNGAVTRIHNCLVAGNYSGHVSGISGRSDTGRTVIENCTITRNEAPLAQPAVYSEHGTTTYGTNCVSYDNYSVSGANIQNGNWVYTLSSPVMPGTGNTNANPLFVSTGTGYGLSLVGGNFRLQMGSPCVNTGTNASWMTGGVNLVGNPRLDRSGTVDMGAYEFVPPSHGGVMLVR